MRMWPAFGGRYRRTPPARYGPIDSGGESPSWSRRCPGNCRWAVAASDARRLDIDQPRSEIFSRPAARPSIFRRRNPEPRPSCPSKLPGAFGPHGGQIDDRDIHTGGRRSSSAAWSGRQGAPSATTPSTGLGRRSSSVGVPIARRLRRSMVVGFRNDSDSDSARQFHRKKHAGDQDAALDVIARAT